MMWTCVGLGGTQIHRIPVGTWFRITVVTLPVLLVCLTLSHLVWDSLYTNGNLTTAAYVQLLASRLFWQVVGNTLVTSMGGAILSIVLGVPLAFLAAWVPQKWLPVFQTVNILPLIIPSYVSALAWGILFGPNGPVNQWAAHDLHVGENVIQFYGIGGIIFSLGVIHYPFVYFLTYAALSQVSTDMLRAASSSGASPAAIFRTILFPLLRPAVLSAGLLAFVTNLDDFGIPAFIGTPGHVTVLSTAIYQEITKSLFSGGFSVAATWSVVTVVIAGAVMLQEAVVSRSAFPYAQGQVLRAQGRQGWVLAVGLGLFIPLLLVTTAIPLFLLLVTALSPTVGSPLSQLSWSHLYNSLTTFGQAETVFQNSVELATISSLACTVTGALAVYTVSRSNGRMGGVLATFLSLPYALPGMIFGLAMIVTFIHPLPLVRRSLYGTMWVIGVAYFIRFLPLSIRTLTPALTSFDEIQLRAASVCGASSLRMAVRILLPAMLPSFISSFLFTFVTALTEMTVSSVLAAPGTETIGMAVLNFEQTGNITSAAAFSLIALTLMAVSGVAGWGCLQVFRRWRWWQDAVHTESLGIAKLAS
ncbi:MAG: iron ABC transporter permease [Alicyclobacillus herbarius]|uniref:ABC transporter permease n=1 Tax=Alicyclobacillus herbarius TaxID=122960 RepID=UPI0023521D3B|nr:iron ABC transporter permease [Alicyclobacillus herbarius]MCL6632293.1 iron ABC transporter permease [Alicyclobacillus herbarius]